MRIRVSKKIMNNGKYIKYRKLTLHLLFQRMILKILESIQTLHILIRLKCIHFLKLYNHWHSFKTFMLLISYKGLDLQNKMRPYFQKAQRIDQVNIISFTNLYIYEQLEKCTEFYSFKRITIRSILVS